MANKTIIDELSGTFTTMDKLKDGLTFESIPGAVNEIETAIASLSKQAENGSDQLKAMVKEIKNLFANKDHKGIFDKFFTWEDVSPAFSGAPDVKILKLNETAEQQFKNEEELVIQTSKNAVTKAEEGKERALLQLSLKERTSAQAQYGKDFGTGMEYSLFKYSASLKQFADNMDQTFQNTFQSMGESFNTLFVSVLDEGFDNVGQIGLDFLQAIRNEMIKTLLVPQIMKGLVGTPTVS